MAAAAKRRHLPAWYKEMEKDLECPVCLVAFLDPPIYVCENQHGLCSTCRTKLNDEGKPCPVCKGTLTDKRNLMIEKLLDNLPKTDCIFPECSFKRFDPQAVLDHQEDCSHRKVTCELCNESVAMSILDQHLKTRHNCKLHRAIKLDWVCGMNFYGGKTVVMFLGPKNTALRKMSFYANYALLDDKNTMRWISYNGPKKDREKYQFSIEVLSTGDPKKVVFSCTKFCVPCDISQEEVKEKHLGVIINKALAQEVNTKADMENPYVKANIQVFPTKSFLY